MTAARRRWRSTSSLLMEWWSRRVTNSDPAFLRILAKSERAKLRYDAAKQHVPRVEVV